MYKDFNRWNEVKKHTDEERPRFYTLREIWWCRLGVNVGEEQDGRGVQFLRPVLIIQGLGPVACFVAPLTTSHREHPFRIPIGLVDGKEARVNISQMRVIDTRRFVEKIGFLEKPTFYLVRKAVKDMFDDTSKEIHAR